MQNISVYSEMFVADIRGWPFCGLRSVYNEKNGPRRPNFTKCRPRKFSTRSYYSGCQAPLSLLPSQVGESATKSTPVLDRN